MTVHTMPKDYMLVLGWSVPARIAVNDLLERGRHVLVVANAENLGIEHPHLQFLHDDPADENALARVHPERAAAAVLCHEIDGNMLIAALALQRLAPGLPITAIPPRSNTAKAIADLGLAASFPSDDLLGHVLARSASAPHAGPLIWQLMSDEHHRIYEVGPNSGEVGQSVEKVRAARSLEGELVLGVLDGDTVQFGLESQTLNPQSRLLVLKRLDKR